jgi:uncharacterized protein YndB with AHSA1/START domain
MIVQRSRPEGFSIMRMVIAALAALLFLSAPARAEVAASDATGFLVQGEADLAAHPDHVWRALTAIQTWWGDAHTYSGDSNNLSLEPRAGGCWCERWGMNSVEHGRVIAVTTHDTVRTLRLYGALGPLQEMGAHGVLTFTITPQPSGAKLTLAYRVSGEPSLGLEAIAPVVDGVMMEQFGRLSRLSTTGSPD